MNMSKTSRTPFQNDLLNDAGQMACLQEQGVPSNFMSLNVSEQHVTLDFMFSVPFMRDNGPSFSVSVTSTTNQTLDADWVPRCDLPGGGGFVPWAIAAHFWAVYVKRETCITFLPIKCYTPVKVRVDYVQDDSITGDMKARRNPTFEFDDSGCHPTTIRVGSIFPASYKLCSLESPLKVPGIITNAIGKDTPNAPFEWIMDGTVHYSLMTMPQPGVVFPRNYNVFVFQSFTNVIASTITTPGQNYSMEKGELATRNVFVLAPADLAQWVNS
jgi:hypothetical protein